MAQKITNAVLLGHIQAMKNDLLMQIGSIKIDVTRLRIDLSSLREEMHEGFEEARQHRQALQEDLNETIRVQGKHQSAIARLTKQRRKNV